MASHQTFTQENLQRGIGPKGNKIPDTIDSHQPQNNILSIKRNYTNISKFVSNLTYLTKF